MIVVFFFFFCMPCDSTALVNACPLSIDFILFFGYCPVFKRAEEIQLPYCYVFIVAAKEAPLSLFGHSSNS